MSTIGKGRLWDVEHIKKLIKYSRIDSAKSNPQNYHFVIKKEDKVVGYVGIHPMIAPYRGELQIRFIVSPEHRGQGIATTAVRKMIAILRNRLSEYHKRIWSVNASENISANKVSTNAGLKFIIQLPIDGEMYNYHELVL